MEYDLIIKNQLSEIGRVHRFIEKLDLSQRTTFNLTLIMDEVLSNIVNYGFNDGEEHAIQIRISSQPGEIHLKFVDDGIDFNPLQMPEPNLDLPIEQRPAGGLGIFIVKRLSQTMIYDRRNNANHLKVILACEPEMRRITFRSMSSQIVEYKAVHI